MPFLNLRTIKGLLNSEQKALLKARFTELLVEIEGGGNPEFRKLVWIQIEEEEPENWQLGELQPTPELIADLVQQHDRKSV